MSNNVVQALEDFQIKTFQENLLTWYRENKRDLPWRKDQDPYKVWVSEIMLQQTRVDTVIPYFNHFIDKFPTIETLAYAEEESVLKAWEGLGYYSRARNLQAAVREVAENYGGKVPDSPKEISSLKGVGPYTSGAILSIAYGIPEPAVDGNVMRVLSRILYIWDDIGKPKTRKIFEEAVRALIAEDAASDFNQALMELGATICTPQSPACLLCPVQEHCRAFSEGVEKELPVKSKKKPPKPLPMAAAVLMNEEGKVLIHRRPSEGLLANLWEFPNHETLSQKGEQDAQLVNFLSEEYEVESCIDDHIANFSHVFSHIKWNIAVYTGKLMGEVKEADDLKLVNPSELQNYPFPVSHQKIIKSLFWKGE
ncbi:A/G-specific adenine glycosylase [Bacillus taeanensis]|uniref:A/G-specific adenine glycosylase n=1 Tax=Bacillus taeanensis TaxID=273032 RepID=UPI0026925E45